MGYNLNMVENIVETARRKNPATTYGEAEKLIEKKTGLSGSGTGRVMSWFWKPKESSLEVAREKLKNMTTEEAKYL